MRNEEISAGGVRGGVVERSGRRSRRSEEISI